IANTAKPASTFGGRSMPSTSKLNLSSPPLTVTRLASCTTLKVRVVPRALSSRLLRLSRFFLAFRRDKRKSIGRIGLSTRLNAPSVSPNVRLPVCDQHFGWEAGEAAANRHGDWHLSAEKYQLSVEGHHAAALGQKLHAHQLINPSRVLNLDF